MSSAAEHDGLSPTKRALLEIRELRARLAQAESRQRTPIAIVGAGLRFPGGVTNLESYWRLLANGVDAICPIPGERWDFDAWFDPDPGAPGRMYTRWGGFLNDIDRFDPYFFDISPREAERMDPQQRLLLETVWEALEHANIPADRLAGSATGVFVGIANSDYFRLLAADPANADLYMTTGSAYSIAAGRISYLLGLQGPSLAVDTACSSSLVALHLAIQSLRSGECNLALAGGVNVILSPEANISFSQARMMAVDGRCKTFDAQADGYVRSEGCGVFALKRLDDALANGDRILAVVRGSALNQDGRSNGLTAPNGPAQEAVIRAALADAGLEPHAVHYVETHGTGTSLGDPIEARALGAALGERGDSGPLLVGSVKTNLGHLEAAAGVAGLLKVVLMLQNGEIPPSLHLTTKSPHIPWAELPLDVPTVRTPWPVEGTPRVAGVSSFGFSGTNAHLLLESAPAVEARPARVSRNLHLLPLSAHNPVALDALAGRYAAHLQSHADLDLADVAATAGQGRAHHAERLAVVATDSAQAVERLTSATRDDETPGVQRGRVRSDSPAVAFLFTGQGAHYPGMGKELYDSAPVFRAAIDRCAEILATLCDCNLLDILFAEPGSADASMLEETRYTQPALFAFEYAMAQLWQSWGVQPAAVAGHSLGEYVAACVAGVFSLEDGLRVVVARGRLMGEIPAEGAMAAVFASEERVGAVLGTFTNTLSIAAVNGPQSIVLSGVRTSVEAAVDNLLAADIKARLLAIPLASHSPLVEPILGAFEAEVAAVTLSAPKVALVSCLTGELVSDEIRSASYWRKHLRQPVRFGAALETLNSLGCNTYIEMGPHPVLLGMARHAVDTGAGIWLPSARRDLGTWEQMLESLGALYVAGGTIDWRGVNAGYASQPVDLPTYPFQRQRYWGVPDKTPQPTSALDRWQSVSGAAQRQAGQGPLDLDAAAYPARWQALNQLATAHVLRCLHTLGLFTGQGERHSVDEIIAGGTILPDFRNVVGRWFRYLASEGLLTAEGEFFSAGAPLPIPDIADVEREATRTLAGLEPLIDYALRSGRQLEAVLTGNVTPLDLLFPGGSYATSDFMYQEWAIARYLSGIVRASVEALVTTAPDRHLRLLEIGAGTGGTTAQVLPVVPGEQATYDFTDVSDFFLTRARERFADYPCLRYGLLDIERGPEEQGYTPHSYDVVIAANVLHATRNLDETLQHVQDLLAPGGLLLLLEGTDHPHWYDITIGLVAGWQAFDDDWRDDVPLLKPDRWEQALLAAGFSEVLALPGNDTSAANLGQHVMLARAPGAVAANVRPETANDEAPFASNGAATTAANTLANQVLDRLSEALPGERHEILRGVVSERVARVLRAEPDRVLPRDQRLLDLGLDSLMAVELRDQLGRVLALSEQLPATLVFDYPSITSIATYLEDEVLWPQERAEPVQVAATTQQPAGIQDVSGLTDEELARLLEQKFERLPGGGI